MANEMSAQLRNRSSEELTWRSLLLGLEGLERGIELMPPAKSNAAHFTRLELANTIARAREALEALANDEALEEQK